MPVATRKRSWLNGGGISVDKRLGHPNAPAALDAVGTTVSLHRFTDVAAPGVPRNYPEMQKLVTAECIKPS